MGMTLFWLYLLVGLLWSRMLFLRYLGGPGSHRYASIRGFLVHAALWPLSILAMTFVMLRVQLAHRRIRRYRQSLSHPAASAAEAAEDADSGLTNAGK